MSSPAAARAVSEAPSSLTVPSLTFTLVTPSATRTSNCVPVGRTTPAGARTAIGSPAAVST